MRENRAVLLIFYFLSALSFSSAITVFAKTNVQAISPKKFATPVVTASSSIEDDGRNLEQAIDFYRAGLLDKAREIFEKISTEVKSLSQSEQQLQSVAHHYLGLVYEKKSKMNEAIWQWKLALAKDPKLAVACFNIGLAYGTLKKPDEEIKWYRKAVNINPHYEKAWNNLGSSYMKKRENRQAMEAFKRALQINPHYAVAAENLAIVYEKLGRKSEAKKQWKYAASIETRSSWKKVLESRAKD